MTRLHPDTHRAADFVLRSARLIDRLRFAFHAATASADAVRAAVLAYQNPDGGFGHALEPDLRAPTSQPAAVRVAVEMLHEVDRLDTDLGSRICDFLATCSRDGGLPFALPSVGDYPCAPWWNVGDDPPPSPVFTAPIAGILHARGVRHPWLTAALAYSWREVDGFDLPSFRGAPWDLPRLVTSYRARALLAFLGHLLERGGDDRTAAAHARLGALVIERGLVELDPDARGDVHGPLEYAPRPTSPMRSLFADDVLEAHLDARVRAQADDGGWPVPWMQWNPTTTVEWRGWLTVEAVAVLTAYGRVA